MTIDVQVAEMRMILQLTQKTLKEFRKKFTFKECKRLLQVVCQFNLEAGAASVLEPPCVQVEHHVVGHMPAFILCPGNPHTVISDSHQWSEKRR